MTALADDVRRFFSLPRPDEARQIRVSGHVTQERLARALNVNRVTVTRWETGRTVPRGWLRDAYREALEDIMIGQSDG